MEGLLFAIVLAFLSPFAMFAAEKFVDVGRRRRANARLVSNPLVKRGARIRKLIATNSGAVLMENCYISSLEVGRVEVKKAIKTESGDKKFYAMDFTGQEFEQLHPVFELHV